MIEEYVLTYDTQESLKAVGIKTKVGDLEKRLKPIIEKALPKTKVIEIEFGELKNKISKEVKKLREDMPIISFDPIYVPKADASVSITRLIDPETGVKKEGPRPGFPSLEEQVNRLSKKFKGKQVALADVGTFEGGSEKLVISLLKNEDIAVGYVINGISTTSANKTFEELKVTEIVAYRKYTSEKNGKFIFEWLEAADLTGIDGRKVGRNGIPLEIKGIPQVYIPYALGYICEWASIPKECSEFVSQKFLDITTKIIDRSEKNSGKKVTIGELGMPIKMGESIDKILQSNITTDTSFKETIQKAMNDGCVYK